MATKYKRLPKDITKQLSVFTSPKTKKIILGCNKGSMDLNTLTNSLRDYNFNTTTDYNMVLLILSIVYWAQRNGTPDIKMAAKEFITFETPNKGLLYYLNKGVGKKLTEDWLNGCKFVTLLEKILSATSQDADNNSKVIAAFNKRVRKIKPWITNGKAVNEAIRSVTNRKYKEPDKQMGSETSQTATPELDNTADSDDHRLTSSDFKSTDVYLLGSNMKIPNMCFIDDGFVFAFPYTRLSLYNLLNSLRTFADLRDDKKLNSDDHGSPKRELYTVASLKKYARKNSGDRNFLPMPPARYLTVIKVGDKECPAFKSRKHAYVWLKKHAAADALNKLDADGVQPSSPTHPTGDAPGAPGPASSSSSNGTSASVVPASTSVSKTPPPLPRIPAPPPPTHQADNSASSEIEGSGSDGYDSDYEVNDAYTVKYSPPPAVPRERLIAAATKLAETIPFSQDDASTTSLRNSIPERYSAHIDNVNIPDSQVLPLWSLKAAYDSETGNLTSTIKKSCDDLYGKNDPAIDCVDSVDSPAPTILPLFPRITAIQSALQDYAGKAIVALPAKGAFIQSSQLLDYFPKSSYYNVIQTASQFNGLESTTEKHSPLYDYAVDKSQGPGVCALSRSGCIRREAAFENGTLPDSMLHILNILTKKDVCYEEPERSGTFFVKSRYRSEVNRFIYKTQFFTDSSNQTGLGFIGVSSSSGDKGFNGWVDNYQNSPPTDVGSAVPVPLYQNGYLTPQVLNEDGKKKLILALANSPTKHMVQDVVDNDEKNPSTFTQVFASAFSYQDLYVAPNDDLSYLMNYLNLLPQFENMFKQGLKSASAATGKIAAVHFTGVGAGAFCNPSGLASLAFCVAYAKYAADLKGKNVIFMLHGNAFTGQSKNRVTAFNKIQSGIEESVAGVDNPPGTFTKVQEELQSIVGFIPKFPTLRFSTDGTVTFDGTTTT